MSWWKTLPFTALVAALPFPYDAVEEVRPFVDHGWYQNAEQLRDLIDRYQVKVIRPLSKSNF